MKRTQVRSSPHTVRRKTDRSAVPLVPGRCRRSARALLLRTAVVREKIFSVTSASNHRYPVLGATMLATLALGLACGGVAPTAPPEGTGATAAGMGGRG